MCFIGLVYWNSKTELLKSKLLQSVLSIMYLIGQFWNSNLTMVGFVLFAFWCNPNISGASGCFWFSKCLEVWLGKQERQWWKGSEGKKVLHESLGLKTFIQKTPSRFIKKMHKIYWNPSFLWASFSSLLLRSVTWERQTFMAGGFLGVRDWMGWIEEGKSRKESH